MIRMTTAELTNAWLCCPAGDEADLLAAEMADRLERSEAALEAANAELERLRAESRFVLNPSSWNPDATGAPLFKKEWTQAELENLNRVILDKFKLALSREEEAK